MRTPPLRRPVTPTAAAARRLAVAAALLALGACASPDTRPPGPPAGLTAQAGSATSVHVMWQSADPREGVTRYQILQGGAPVREVPADKTMVDLTGLAPLTAYSFTVRAEDAAGNLSAPSAAAAVTTPAAKAEDHRPPTAPATAAGHPDGARAAVLTWAPATDDTGVTAYDVYQGGVRIHTAGATETGTRLTGLQPDTVYTFTVRARDGADNSSPDSPPVDVTTATATGKGPVTSPADFTATASPGAVALSWTPPDTGKPTAEYQLYVNGQPTTVIQFGAGAVPVGRAAYQLAVSEPAGTVWALKLRARLPDGNWGSFSAERRVPLG
ncbi:fibronectin type III domain-containing protein [Streptomyces sp. NBC_00536]|uniref:fibronectin type III domain-containing protein n=1 Tax=Streptomyces sp. NBC_00536 TaxID=2975769 RepID=UPI002E801203|nr:fibronectin type III domain-containing protein [Streptomyces sp. NBC_00536]WUC77825.1 fibronectin type III domain-containing protein [Streptomyces sp. NBC_00536]